MMYINYIYSTIMTTLLAQCAMPRPSPWPSPSPSRASPGSRASRSRRKPKSSCRRNDRFLFKVVVVLGFSHQESGLNGEIVVYEYICQLQLHGRADSLEFRCRPPRRVTHLCARAKKNIYKVMEKFYC